MSDSGTTSTIKRSSTSRARTRRKPKKSQLPFAIVLILALIVLGTFVTGKSNNLSWYLLTGLIFGYILQRSRFCFTASMRDPYLTGGTTVTRAVLIAFAITTIGFTAIKYGYFKNNLPIPGMGYVVPISFATIFGAFIFGIGMVIAGGCASGTLMRVGEGFTMQIISLIFFIIGSLWGAHDFGWWKYHFISKGKAVFLPDVFGWVGAVVIQLLIIFCLYVAAEKYQEAKADK
ncbi:YeeE/YedE thiosulfate transporter family protein [Oceanirhabdus sp. W0125-5]|uniref:YeeE/YedE thiosulfate transporter family protein n=1 Tax=Oceanirhabdus sp. W0125-5 TaxID=2999116 RepID=UPI0022F2CDF2|nr:YeeE/YedE thiosulfate transporter family protein [Oceanirhabdus sp. W0125-5]WBW98869.1 YeeE/YedE thiosulfate transporter family protein [Oceanirhabdus sp. W0125-5]